MTFKQRWKAVLTAWRKWQVTDQEREYYRRKHMQGW